MRVPTFVVNYLKKQLRPLSRTGPDEIVGPGERWRKVRAEGDLPARPFLLRWFVFPKNRWCNVYLHCFIRDDEDRALHDHPWANLSLLLAGQYIECTIPAGGVNRHELFRAGDLKFRHATDAHCIRLTSQLPTHWYDVGDWLSRTDGKWCCWSLFITGPVRRKWGFHCPGGWRSSTEFHDKGGCIND